MMALLARFARPPRGRCAFVRHEAATELEAHDNVAALDKDDEGRLYLVLPDGTFSAVYQRGEWKSAQHPEAERVTALSRLFYRAPTARRDAFVRITASGAWEVHGNVTEIYPDEAGILCLEAPDGQYRSLYAAGEWKSVQHPEVGRAGATLTAIMPRTVWPGESFGDATVQSHARG